MGESDDRIHVRISESFFILDRPQTLRRRTESVFVASPLRFGVFLQPGFGRRAKAIGAKLIDCSPC
jgi:hypothetical protein